MPAPIQGLTGGVSGVNGERGTASADLIAEARQRQADRLRAAQAEAIKATEVVEETRASAESDNGRQPDPIPPYRVNLDPGTGRLSTEVLDTHTGEVILRIPPSYADPAEDAAEESGRPKAPEVKA
ncbi:hypothetical protein ABAZ39_30560 (plasmid) [Azospirillum argentinense]|uniref:Uncharacterized protein n=1 Tax=Azospirillum argentinense TaxID=2970906 RepID=A0A2K1FTQ4_9PROT|nr:hypothetical protein [Azospirillum argentinense]AIB16201.1 hypothetical protein ABAZ39_30560 [Azospirillum argentinense]EZQ02647.1 hypothetical protein ABAZ39_30920 [Azospirillum argentinense]KAA1056832.1 hypothetical protein FH063_003705 [Azospirillum argentinense]PNQ95916.1 hypothetical protein C1S70_26425 [Azospirillum argentinense]